MDPVISGPPQKIFKESLLQLCPRERLATEQNYFHLLLIFAAETLLWMAMAVGYE